MQIHENVKFIGKKIGWVWSKNASGHCHFFVNMGKYGFSHTNAYKATIIYAEFELYDHLYRKPIMTFRWHTFFYLGFLSRTLTIYRTPGEWGGYLFNYSLPLPPVPQTLRH